MDSQNQQPVAPNQQPVQQVLATTTPKPALSNSYNNKKKINISDEQARALLALNNLQDSHAQHKVTKLPIGLIISIVTVVAVVIIASILVGGLKSRTNSNTSSSSSTPSSSSNSNPNNNDPTDNQINQDENSCSNPLTALSEC